MNHIPAVVNKIVGKLITDINAAIPDLIDGVYLTGSIPLNDFYPGKSDIDFIVLCQSPSENVNISQLQRIHDGIKKQFKKPQLSGFYITNECLHLTGGKTMIVPGVHEGKVKEMIWGDGLTAVTLKELKAIAYTFSGMSSQLLPIEVTKEDVDHTIFENINSYWLTWINKHATSLLRYSLLVSFPWFTEWSILGVARQFYTLQTGKITSKLQAGHFALDHVPDEYHQIIQQAIKIRKVYKQFQFAPSIGRAKKTIDCVNYVIDSFNKEYHTKYAINHQKHK